MMFADSGRGRSSHYSDRRGHVFRKDYSTSPKRDRARKYSESVEAGGQNDCNSC